MNSKSRKRLIIVALIIFNVLAIVKIADNTKMQVTEDNELKGCIRKFSGWYWRQIADKLLYQK